MPTPSPSETVQRILVRAFAEDPLFRFIQPDPARRPGTIAWVARCAVRQALRRGRVDVLDDVAAAVWLAPGRSQLRALDIVRSGFVAAPVRIGIPATRRLVASEQDLADIPFEARDPQAWYLFLLGVDPEAQGRGLARRLLRPVFDEADRTRRNIRLETNAERNLAFYERLGFDVVAAKDTPGLLPQWALVRRPATVAS